MHWKSGEHLWVPFFKTCVSMPPATRKATHKPSFFGGGAIGLFGRALDAEPDPGGLDLEVGSKGRAFFKISGGPVLPQAFGGVTGAFGVVTGAFGGLTESSPEISSTKTSSSEDSSKFLSLSNFKSRATWISWFLNPGKLLYPGAAFLSRPGHL